MSKSVEYRQVRLRQVGRSAYSVSLTNPTEFIGIVHRIENPVRGLWGWRVPGGNGLFFLGGFKKRKEAVRHLIYHEVDFLPDGFSYESLNVLIDLFRLNKDILPDCPEA